MIIKDLYARPIWREIKGVIKVGQDDDGNIQQELEEYVVTRELEKHFRDFFSAYKQGIVGTTDAMGVWISGFFGSGKSHFLKIIAYLLENKLVGGKHALDYFLEDNKIKDASVIADMRLASSVPTDVILFNIDSKSDSREAIVSVFLRAFNEELGFSGSIPHLADLERKLSEDGRYEEFKEKMEASTGKPWTEARHDFDFIEDHLVKVLPDMNFMSKEAVRNWCEKATWPYKIAIEDFAKMVKRYIDQKGNNHHVVFLVDEIGQYIGDDSSLMLNLQTVTEDLGRFCHGKAWVIVTSQQDIDSITKTKGNDFSKIQGRFDTRISLSSANVDEVIRERILKKTPSGNQSLALLYDDKATDIKNKIQFNDGVEKKLYANRDDFADVYPFVPYQFNIVGDVLTSIRTHGASGKHLSDGERSMLALFKESAQKIMDEQPGTLVPFYMFYDALDQFLDHSHRGVITKALDNEYLNPEHAEECFDVNVLKTLFLIKYVKEVQANLEQITSLMVPHMNVDRLALKQKVEDALNRLIRQMLVQKNGDVYVFLTNEEQEINREIERQGEQIEQGEIIARVSELIFDGIYAEKKYRYPAFNGRYQFPFNQMVDNRPYKNNQNYDLTLKILTPYSDEIADEHTLRLVSGQSSCVLVVLPDDAAFLTEIRMVLSIERFLRADAVNGITKYEQIKEAKKSEMRSRSASAKLFLEEALKDAAIYVSGNRLSSTSRDIKARINEAMDKLVTQIYHKLYYITTPVSESDIREVLRSSDQQITLDKANSEKNQLALNDVANYISANTAHHTKTSMKSTLDRFMKAPYGFIEADVEWLVAKLFKAGDIAFFVNSEPVTLLSKSVDEIFRFITRKEYNERLMMDRREKASDKQKKAVREVMMDLFHGTTIGDDDDAIMKSFMSYAESFRGKLEQLEVHYQNQPKYPGRQVVRDGKTLMIQLLGIKFSSEFFQTIDQKKDEILDLAEAFEPVSAFFKGDQRSIFDKSILYMGIYDDSKTFVVDTELEDLVGQIKTILHMPSPYREIYKLPELNERFSQRYNAILDEQLAPALEAVNEARNRVFEVIAEKGCEVQFKQRAIDRFAEITDKANKCNNVAALKNIAIEADALKIRFLQDIDAFAAIRDTPPATPDLFDPNPDPQPKPPAKKRKKVSIKTVNASSTWQIETEEDVDKYIAALQAKLKGLLEDNTVLTIEF